MRPAAFVVMDIYIYMNLTNKQKQALHSAARAAGVTEEQRRMIQYNVGGFYSAADSTVSRGGFIAVMAFYESRCNGTLPGCAPDYWKGQDTKANPTGPMVYLAKMLSSQLGLAPEQLDAFIAGPHFSRGQFHALDDLPGVWLRKLIEALKAMLKRKGKQEARA